MGSDSSPSTYEPSHRSFNSRSRMGSDIRSIVHSILQPRFNSRSRMGSDNSLQFHRRLV